MITHFIPYEPSPFSASYRSFLGTRDFLIKSYPNESIKTVCLSPIRRKIERKFIKDFGEVVFVPKRRIPLGTKPPFLAPIYLDKSEINKVIQIFNKSSIVYIEHSFGISPFLDSINFSTDPRKFVIINHNYESLYFQRMVSEQQPLTNTLLSMSCTFIENAINSYCLPVMCHSISDVNRYRNSIWFPVISILFQSRLKDLSDMRGAKPFDIIWPGNFNYMNNKEFKARFSHLINFKLVEKVNSMLIAGNNSFKHARSAYKILQDYRCSINLFFSSNVSDFNALYEQSSLCYVPGDYETGIPTKLFEAIAFNQLVHLECKPNLFLDSESVSLFHQYNQEFDYSTRSNFRNVLFDYLSEKCFDALDFVHSA